MDEREERPPYQTKTTPLKLDEVVTILRNPDDRRTITQPPPTPRGGEVYLYRIQDFEEDVWKKDKYYFRSDGKQKQPKNDPLIVKEFHKAYKGDTSTTKRFVKEVFYLCGDEPQYVLVHYRGDHTLAFPKPKPQKQSMKTESQSSDKTRKLETTEAALLSSQSSTSKVAISDHRDGQSSNPKRSKIDDLCNNVAKEEPDVAETHPSSMQKASSLDPSVVDSPVENSIVLAPEQHILSPEQHIVEDSPQSELDSGVNQHTGGHTDGHVIDKRLQKAVKRKIQSNRTSVTCDDDIVYLGKESSPVKQPRLQIPEGSNRLCKIVDSEVSPLTLRDSTDDILKKRDLIPIINFFLIVHKVPKVFLFF